MLRSGGHALLPLALLIVLLVVGFTPTYAAGVSILAVIAASWLGRTPMGPRAIRDALALGARNMVTTGLLLVAVGLVVNAIVTTGIGNTVSLMISDWAGGSLLLTLVLVALAAVVLGLGLPVTATYVVLATLSAPALYVLITEAQLVQLIASGGLPAEAKAIFLLTAPEAAAEPRPADAGGGRLGAARRGARRLPHPAPAAGAVPGRAHDRAALGAHDHLLAGAGLEHHPAGLHHRLRRRRDRRYPADGDRVHGLDDRQEPLHHAASVRLHAVPRRRLLALLWIFAFGTVGIYALTAAISGWMEAPLSWPERVLPAATGTALLWPTGPIVNVPGFLFFLALFAFNLWRGRRNRARSAAAA